MNESINVSPGGKTRRRKTEKLHLGRASLPGALYFVTFVTANRMPWLGAPLARQTFLQALRRWHEERDGCILAASVMPDHVHVLFSLGAKLSLGRCVSRWKTVTRSQCGHVGDWQRDFWEHRLRDDEAWEDYGLYIFLNPYRGGLIRRGTWPGWWAPEERWFRFLGGLEADGGPPKEWIEWPEDRFANITTGE